MPSGCIVSMYCHLSCLHACSAIFIGLGNVLTIPFLSLVGRLRWTYFPLVRRADEFLIWVTVTHWLLSFKK